MFPTPRSCAKLRVAIVAPSIAILGGQAVQAQRLLAAWARDPEIEAWLVPINPLPPRWLRVATRIKYLRTVVTQLVYWPLLLRELRGADVVHVFSASYWSFLLAPLPAILIARAMGRPVLLNYRSGEAPDHLQRSRLARTILAIVDQNIVPSAFLSDVFASFGIASRIIPNIVDRERFRFRLREPLRPRLISTRNFEPLYNVACALRTFQRVQAQYPGASLTLIGGGTQEASLRRIARELNLRAVVFAGRVAPDEIHHYYDDADIYIQTPTIDNMPSSVLEAFASGLPVVSTDAGGISAILTDGIMGFLAPLDDDVRMAECVIRFLEDPPLARRVALAAYSATAALTWDNVRNEWAAAYRGLAALSFAATPTQPA